MDARTTAALAAVLRDANCAAVAKNARLRQALRHAREAVLQGDKARALHRLAQALGEPPRAPPRTARGHLFCALCGGRAASVVQMHAVGRWQDLPPQRRPLCRACFRMQP